MHIQLIINNFYCVTDNTKEYNSLLIIKLNINKYSAVSSKKAD